MVRPFFLALEPYSCYSVGEGKGVSKLKVGDIVKYVGVPRYYQGTIGVVTQLYNTHSVKKNGRCIPNSAIVYIADKPEGRSLPGLGQSGPPCFHPMSLTEIEVIN